MDSKSTEKFTFSKYQIFIIAILSFIQFTVILDFMVLSPLSAILLDELSITTSQFSDVVSAYAFSAGISALLVGGFADKFDRKKMLLFFYMGFVVGTALCAMATSYGFLLFARIFTGIFGGVLSSIGFAIITDLFAINVRGRVLGFVQMAFAASQILGIPVGLALANSLGWHAPFWMIVAISIIVGLLILVYMKPISEHLQQKTEHNPLLHLWQTLSNRDYIRGFMATILLATGGFMLMPFGAAFSTGNLKLSLEQLPWLYGITGVSSIISGPIIGKYADRIGKFRVFVAGSIISIAMVGLYTNLGPTPLWIVLLINIILFVGINARMIPAQALLTAVPAQTDRGSFMSVNSSIQQLSGGVASKVAGLIVFREASGHMSNYPLLGMVVIGSMLVAILLMYILNTHVQKTIKDGGVQRKFA
ncbi:MAG TPA: MFS transporter [Patescibacteria group bacterium]|nr:MFS transporter [Patescibacteria group bacterium]